MRSGTGPEVEKGNPMSGAGIRENKEPREDIQILRGLAIILVLLHHASVPGVPGGFLGVDIFFVLSGYLITGLIVEALDQNRFSWRDFYVRRIKRLFPAAYATLAVTALLAPVFLDSVEYRNFAWQLLGSFAFVANIVLWRQSDYFGSEAAFKPLLHMWSLSIEEQFYIVLPPLLHFCAVRLRLALVAALTLVSAVMCFVLVDRMPSATFYLLPTRAWELGLGSAMAIAVQRGLIRPRAMPAARLVSTAMLLITPLVTDERGHPGLAAAVVCIATALLVVPGARLGRGEGALRPMAVVGNRSYSLYLVHWPVFSFAYHVSLRPLSLEVSLLLLLLCFAWAELQYRLIERRFRRDEVTWPRIAALVVVPIIAVAASLVGAQSRVSAITLARAGNDGLSPACDFRHGFEVRDACRAGTDPRVLVWGDSFAMALVEGIRETAPGGVVQATRTVCGPFLGIAPNNGAQYPRSWAESCIRFNQSVIDHIAREPRIETVVLSSALVQYLPGAEDIDWRLLVASGSRFENVELDRDLLLAALAQTAEAVRALGRRVVLFAPPPADQFDVARCLDRVRAGQLLLPRRGHCNFSRSSYEVYRYPILEFLRAVEERDLLTVVTFNTALCGSGNCIAELDGVLLYRDSTHLSRPGSRLLAERMEWGQWLKTPDREVAQ
jgi:peptidoglycan/LPS O-acetylase OafA/YrhL